MPSDSAWPACRTVGALSDTSTPIAPISSVMRKPSTTTPSGDVRAVQQRPAPRLYIFGLTAEEGGGNEKLAGVMTLLLDMRQEAKARKEWSVSDRIRDRLSELGITVKDRKDGYDWEITV